MRPRLPGSRRSRCSPSATALPSSMRTSVSPSAPPPTPATNARTVVVPGGGTARPRRAGATVADRGAGASRSRAGRRTSQAAAGVARGRRVVGPAVPQGARRPVRCHRGVGLARGAASRGDTPNTSLGAALRLRSGIELHRTGPRAPRDRAPVPGTGALRGRTAATGHGPRGVPVPDARAERMRNRSSSRERKRNRFRSVPVDDDSRTPAVGPIWNPRRVPTTTAHVHFPEDVPGDFETHVTFRCSDADIAPLTIWGRERGAGMTHIVLGCGRTPSQPMLTLGARTTLGAARRAATRLAAGAGACGFHAVRVRIEAAPWHAAVPATDAAAALGHAYFFEHHVKLVLGPGPAPRRRPASPPLRRRTARTCRTTRAGAGTTAVRSASSPSAAAGSATAPPPANSRRSPRR